MTERDDGESLRADLALLPGLLEDAVNGVTMYARGLTDLVDTLDARVTSAGRSAPPLPPLDGRGLRLVAAARRGPEAAALELAQAARLPAQLALPETEPQPYAGPGDAARAAAALLAMEHHNVEDVDVSHLMADASPTQVAVLLAQIAVSLARDAVTDVDEWLAQVGAAWALDEDGDDA